MTVRKRMSALLSSIMTAGVLAAVITPAHADTKSEAAVGRAYNQPNFGGLSIAMESNGDCKSINFPDFEPVRSAVNTSTSSSIELFSDRSLAGFCSNRVTTLGPGKTNLGFDLNTGELNYLGRYGASFYSVFPAQS